MVKPRKLSERQRLLLRLIAAKCVPGVCFWVPQFGPEGFTDAEGYDRAEVSGSGDAAILRSFVKHGWTIPRSIEYSYEITEAGRAILANAIRENEQNKTLHRSR